MADYYVATTGNDTTGDGSTGNPYASIGKVGSLSLATSDRILIKSGNYTLTSSTANTAGGPLNLSAQKVTIIGYETTVGDSGARPVISAGSLTSITMIDAGIMTAVVNVSLDGNNGTGNRGINIGWDQGSEARRCRFANFKNKGINSAANTQAVLCEFSNCTVNVACSASRVFGCYADGCTAGSFDSIISAAHCVSKGATSGIGFDMSFKHSVVTNCVSYGDSYGFRETANGNSQVLVNCIAVGATNYGFDAFGGGALMSLVNCAGYSNTSGNVSSGVRYNTGFVTLTGNPFTNATGGDFSLNTTAGAGAACRAAGIPGAFPGGATTGYLDIGAAQHQDSGTGSGGGMIGGGGLSGGLQ